MLAFQSTSWWQGGEGMWPSELQERSFHSKEGDEAKQVGCRRTLKGARDKGTQPLCSLCFSGVKNKLYTPGVWWRCRVPGAV